MVVTDSLSLFMKSKTDLLKDCRSKTVSFRIKGSGNTVYSKIFRQPTKVDTYHIWFGKSALSLPRNRKLIRYTDNELTILDEEGNVKVAYEVKRG